MQARADSDSASFEARPNARRARLQLALYTLALGSLVAPPALADTEVVTHCVNDYAKVNGSTYCCSGCDELGNAVSDGTKFLAGANFAGIYDQVKAWTNQAVDGRDFTDASQFTWGQDSVDDGGTDWADVIFYSGHGGWSSGSKYSYIVVGDNNASETCLPRIADDTATARHMEFGNGGAGQEADAFVLFACNSAQYEVWEAGGYNVLSAAGSQFNILNGFHGIAWEVSGYQTDLQNYSADAVNNNIGDAWIDRMYTLDGGEADSTLGCVTSDDQCPTSIVWGANASETDEYWDDAGWLDFHDTGARSGTLPRLHFVCGCNPCDGKAQPSC